MFYVSGVSGAGGGGIITLGQVWSFIHKDCRNLLTRLSGGRI